MRTFEDISTNVSLTYGQWTSIMVNKYLSAYLAYNKNDFRAERWFNLKFLSIFFCIFLFKLDKSIRSLIVNGKVCRIVIQANHTNLFNHIPQSLTKLQDYKLETAPVLVYPFSKVSMTSAWCSNKRMETNFIYYFNNSFVFRI